MGNWNNSYLTSVSSFGVDGKVSPGVVPFEYNFYYLKASIIQLVLNIRPKKYRRPYVSQATIIR